MDKRVEWVVKTTQGRFSMFSSESATCEDVALAFSLKYCGDKGEVLEIIPKSEEEFYAKY